MGKACALIMAVVGSCAMGVTSCFVIFAPGQSCPSVAASSPAVAVRATTCKRRQHHLQAKRKKSDRGRPSLDDVERLSRGQAAKKRGTGSRGVCHRLNESERKAYDLAKKQGYVVLRGTGYRRERKGSPLQNIFRQFCDAKAIPCTSVLTGQGPDAVDEVEIDFSPLRTSRDVMDSLFEQADAVAAELEAPLVELELELAGGAEDAGETTADAAASFAGESAQRDQENAGTEKAIEDDELGEGVEEEEEWTGDPNNRPIWKFPVVSRVYRCDSRKQAKDVAVALASVR
ncbi:unnamed protein product [Ectocarpus sp. 13 AM-2016]